MPSKDQLFKIASAQHETVDIRITEVAGVQAENLGLKTWGAAYILANEIHQLKQLVGSIAQDRELNVLEIGAGTGLSGLAAAIIWKTDVIITDLPTIIPGMQANIDLNQDTFNRVGVNVRCGTLDWSRPDHLDGPEQQYRYQFKDHKFQVILAADTLYSEDHPSLMARTIFQWLDKTKEACFIVCYAQRIAYLDHIRELWRLLEEGGLRSVQEGIEVGDESWDEEAPFEWAVFKWKGTHLPAQ